MNWMLRLMVGEAIYIVHMVAWAVFIMISLEWFPFDIVVVVFLSLLLAEVSRLRRGWYDR